MSSLKPAERRLFYSLWIILFVGAGIWIFARSPGAERSPAGLRVALNPELREIFESPYLLQKSPTTFLLHAKLKPEYRASLNGTAHPLTIGFELLKGTFSAYTGSLPCVLSPSDSSFSAEIKLLRPTDFQVMRLYIDS